MTQIQQGETPAGRNPREWILLKSRIATTIHDTEKEARETQSQYQVYRVPIEIIPVREVLPGSPSLEDVDRLRDLIDREGTPEEYAAWQRLRSTWAGAGQ